MALFTGRNGHMKCGMPAAAGKLRAECGIEDASNRRRVRPVVRRRVIVIEEPARLAGFLRDLRPRPLCHDNAHMLPVEMRFIAEARSDNGSPTSARNRARMPI